MNTYRISIHVDGHLLRSRPPDLIKRRAFSRAREYFGADLFDAARVSVEISEPAVFTFTVETMAVPSTPLFEAHQAAIGERKIRDLIWA